MKFVHIIKRVSLFSALTALLSIVECFSQSYLPNSDTGSLQEIYGDKIYVQGLLGEHIFEMITPCSWCELGVTVTISFNSLTRATMVPETNILKSAPVQLFVVKDGREQGL